jgi:endonuclease/exonuclease/phosphatase family metal-dependent hydrolase
VITKQTLTVHAIYCLPRYSIYTDHYLELFQKLNGRFIIGGDFNAKHAHWGSKQITSKGRQLYQAGMDYECEVVPTGKSTYWPPDPNKLPDLIDFFVVKNISANCIHIDEGYDLNSDHSPILLTIKQTNKLRGL